MQYIRQKLMYSYSFFQAQNLTKGTKKPSTYTFVKKRSSIASQLYVQENFSSTLYFYKTAIFLLYSDYHQFNTRNFSTTLSLFLS